MTLPSLKAAEAVHVSESVDNSARIAELRKAKRKLAWSKHEDGEELAERIDREIARLRAEEGSA